VDGRDKPGHDETFIVAKATNLCEPSLNASDEPINGRAYSGREDVSQRTQLAR
jgi:hypothetical protein